MVGIYGRQSVDKKDSISIEVQIETCKSKLALNEPYKIYEEKGFSGKNTERPQFLQMMRDIENNKITKVIVYKLDRISRAILDFANMMETFEKYNVNIISCNDPIDTTTPTGRAMLNVTMTFAQLERETIQQRLKDSFYSRGRKGYYLGGHAPFGYKKVDTILNNKKTYKFEPEIIQAPQLYDMYLKYGETDISLGGLCEQLNINGVKTYWNGFWNPSALGYTLRNPVYVKADADVYLYLKNKGAIMNNDVDDYLGENGCYIYADRKGLTRGKFSDLNNNYVTIAPHIGIIPSNMWLRCQYKLDKNKQIKNNGKGSHSWLSGLLKCGYCKMAANVVKNKKDNRYIQCTGRKLKICYEKKRVIKVEEIEIEVQGQLLQRIERIKNEEPTIIIAEENTEVNNLKIQLVQIEEKINNYVKQIGEANDVVMKYINQNIIELDKNKEDVILKITELNSNNIKPDYNGIELDYYIENWDDFEMEERKRIAKNFIKKIDITDDFIDVIFF